MLLLTSAFGRRRRSFSHAMRAAQLSATRRFIAMNARLRERWTKDEVLALPPGEHNYFERKSGAFLRDDGLREKLAKAVSAFANSGGGHLVFGVKDDGDPDGAEPMRGRQSTRE